MVTRQDLTPLQQCALRQSEQGLLEPCETADLSRTLLRLLFVRYGLGNAHLIKLVEALHNVWKLWFLGIAVTG